MKIELEQARQIRQLWWDEQPVGEIAEQYGISPDYVGRLVRGEYHRDPDYQPPSREIIRQRQQRRAGVMGKKNRKLSLAEARAIHSLYFGNEVYTQSQIAEMFNVSDSCINDLLVGRSYKDIFK
jgi:uncharacterized protein YjcR